MMQKVHYQTDQESLLEACGGHMSELIDTEVGVKSAASDLISKDVIEQHRPDKDHFLIHCVAMGDTETYGPNKNADGWSKQALADYHQTFVTNGHMFREHRNRDPKKKIGDIKYAAYKPIDEGGMGRVELLMWGNKKKAEEEYEMAKEGKELSFSMSAKVKKDVCNVCGHESKSPLHYCEHMKEARLQYIPEFKKYAFVWNPEPNFFDNSRVVRPADRVARYLDYKFGDDDMAKAASAEDVVLGTEWAEFEGLSLPEDIKVDLDLHLQGLLKEAAAWEEAALGILTKQASATDEEEAFVKLAAKGIYEESPWNDVDMAALTKLEPGTLMRHLAKRAMIMPFETFFSYATGTPVDQVEESAVYHKAACCMPGVMKALCGGAPVGMANLFGMNSELASNCDANNTDLVEGLMDKADRAFCAKPEAMKPRMMRISVTKIKPKIASDEVSQETAEKVAQAYGVYQLQALKDIEELNPGSLSETARKAVITNNQKYTH